jgi:hypothetical protein
MRKRITAFFAMVDHVAKGLPSLTRLIVELALVYFAILGILAVLKGHT